MEATLTKKAPTIIGTFTDVVDIPEVLPDKC
jgi:hypothetical protein